jgi:RND family efflux transporter MFP subunit
MLSFRSLPIPVGLMVLAAVSLTGCSETLPESTAKQEVTVTVSKPLVKNITDFEYFTGQTAAVESVEVRARVSGYLKEILFEEGKEVKKDARLFVIDPRPYQAAFDQAEGNVKAAEARLKRQDSDIDRVRRLMADRASSREEYDKAIGDREETAGSLFALKAGVEQAKLDLDFTTVTAPVAGMVSRAEVTIGNLVKADSTPLTTIVSVDPMYVNFNVDERTVLDVQERVRQGHFKTVAEASVPVWISLATSANEYPYEGKLQFIDNRVNTGTGMLQVRAVLPNPKINDGPRRFTPGLFVRVKVPISDSIQRLLVVDRAIGSDLDQKFVYVVDNQNVVERRPVKVGPLEKDLRVVLPVPVVKIDKGWRPAREGEKGQPSLREGDRVIISGLQQVYPGVTVRANEVKMPGSEGAAQ